ncbi:hypothetical protein C8D87_114151 [Lentzea atacamensis]|uniref:Uncharacterized protein n=1 Tax=Lentzea atacamensis TaxID=531938 RepID=A0ABX9DYN2_9PSEU|nr:hypothetical protein [Lentzea atacamensis]RAS59539.1 hypothetical protein C8D87_114151 [Lentzea atacamensis]
MLRAGWKLTPEGLVQCDLPYDPNLGLITDPADDEYDADQAREPEPLHRHAVGELYQPGRTHPWPDNVCQWRLSDQGVELLMLYSAPNETEIQDVREGEARFALLAGEHALILAHRFGTRPWADTPWQACRQLDAPTGLPLIAAEGHLQVIVQLVDSKTGIIKAIRATTWPGRFVEAVRAAMRKQALNASTDAQGGAEINAWYLRYPKTPDLVRAADINVRGGAASNNSGG